MKISSINWLKSSNKNEPDCLIMWTNEPLNSQCKIYFRTFENKEILTQFLNTNKIYNKQQAIQMLTNV